MTTPSPKSIDHLLTAYLTVAVWADGPEPDPEEEALTISDLHPEFVERSRKDVEIFYAVANEIFASNPDRSFESWPENYTGVDLMNDFLLTRNGHGTGFWDDEILSYVSGASGESVGDILTRIAEAFGDVELWFG